MIKDQEGAYQEVPHSKVRKHVKVKSTTWAMKKTSSGIFRARSNMRELMRGRGT